MELKNYFAQDAEGNILGGATCYLYVRGTESFVEELQEANGLALGNPFFSDQQGLIQFAAPNGLYDLRVIKGSRDYRLRVQCNDVMETTAAAERAAYVLEEKLADETYGAAMLGSGVMSVASIHDLLTTIRKKSLTYRVASYREGWATEAVYFGPLGGGDFKWMPDSTIPTDFGMVFQVPGVEVGRFHRLADFNRVQAESYGAVGNGAVDDTDALHLVCRSKVPYESDYGFTFLKSGGREIVLRPGANYKITKPIYLRKGDWLKGGGYTSTRIFTNQHGIGNMIYMGHGLIDGVITKDLGGLVPKVSDICFAETVGGVNAIFLDGISGWDVRDCWFFADVCVRTKGITNDGYMLNCVADNGSGHLAIFEGTGDTYHTGQTTVVEACNSFKTRYGGIMLDGVSDVTIKSSFFNFVPYYGVYTGYTKTNSRIKIIKSNFKGDIGGVGMDATQQHIRVTAPTKGFAIVDCGFSYSRNADVQANYPVQIHGGYSSSAANDSIYCVGGLSKISGMTFEDTGRYPIRSTVRVSANDCDFINPLIHGIPSDVFATGAIYLTGSASKSTVFNCKRLDANGPVLSTNGVSKVRSSGNISDGDIDVLHYTGTGVNYTTNERAHNPVAWWRNVELLRNGYTRWIDTSGKFRVKNGDPVGDTDGALIGIAV